MRLTALVLSFFLLLQGMDISVNDLLRLDDLLEHARYHRDQDGDSIWVFLARHYGHQGIDHQHQGDGEQDHKKLPFQAGNSPFSQVIALVNTDYPKTVLDSPETPQSTQNLEYHKGFYDLLRLQRIFQPPRRT